MRTPGNDFELAAGFLHGEGILGAREDVADISYCMDEEEDQAFNIVTVTLRPGLVFDASRLERNFYTTSSCGVCGKAALESLEVQGCDMVPAGFVVSVGRGLRATSEATRRTGCVRADGWAARGRPVRPRGQAALRCKKTWAATTPSTS